MQMNKLQHEFSGKWTSLVVVGLAMFVIGMFVGYNPDYGFTIMIVLAGIAPIGFMLWLSEKFDSSIYDYLIAILFLTLAGLLIGMATEYFQLYWLNLSAIDTAVVPLGVILILSIEYFEPEWFFLKEKSQKWLVLTVALGYCLIDFVSGYLFHELYVVEIILSDLVGAGIAWMLIRRWEWAVKRAEKSYSDWFVVESSFLPSFLIS